MNPKERISQLLAEAWSLRDSEQWDRMLELAAEARNLAIEFGFAAGVPRATAVQAFVHYIRSDFRSALSECIDALHNSHGDAEAEGRTRSVLGMVHWSLGNYEEALKNVDRAIELLEGLGDELAAAFGLAVKGGILLALGQPEEALTWHQRSIEAFKSFPEEAVGRARALAGLGLTYLAQKRHQDALASLLDALEIARGAKHCSTIARTLNDLGEVFEALDNDEQALIYHTEALQIREQEDYRQAQSTSLLALGRVYARKGEHARAIEYLERGLRVAEELGLRPRLAQFHHTLADVYQKLGQLAPALDHFMASERVRAGLDVDQAALRYRAVVFESQLETLQRNAELESLASLGGLVAAIAHEINSPLGAIQSSANVTLLAAGKLNGTTDPKVIDALKTNARTISEASRRISQLVTRLKLLAGIDQARYTQMNLNQAIEDVVALLRPEFDQRVDVTIEMQPTPPVYVFATELYQVFLNLLRNAIQAIEGAGSVHVRLTADEDRFRIAFTDTGRGISEASIPQLFTPGFTAGSGRVRASLSLFTCLMVTKRHGGDIKVQSELGKGATFTVELPRSLESSDPHLETAIAGHLESRV